MIRTMTEADKAFVLDAWLRSSAELPWLDKVEDDGHLEGFGQVVCALSKRDQVLVACDDEDHDVLHGFVAFDPCSDTSEGCVDYVYVKRGMRRLGVCRDLLEAASAGWRTKRASLLPRGGRLPRGWSFDPWSAVRRAFKP